MDGQDKTAAGHKRAWFYYALARLAVTRNLVVAISIAVICLGAVGLTLWAVGVRAQARPEWLPPLPAAPPAEEESLFTMYQIGHDGPTMYIVDPNEHPELYVPVTFAYQCGHSGRFTPADNQYSAYHPAEYKAQLEQQLCPACRAQADYKAGREQPRGATDETRPEPDGGQPDGGS